VATRTAASPVHRLEKVRTEAATCQRCPLYRNATQTVFGEGAVTATIMMVGEQPGDQEDLTGSPFAGPAGRILDRALDEIGLKRRSIYLTNTVKHFKYQRRGKKRIHQRPRADEIKACRWWLDFELALVRPKLVVALGVTAASALAGRPVTLSRVRGQELELAGLRGMATVHPSSILRAPDEDARHAAYARFVADLKAAKRLADP
jgi:DNA polymerase